MFTLFYFASFKTQIDMKITKQQYETALDIIYQYMSQQKAKGLPKKKTKFIDFFNANPGISGLVKTAIQRYASTYPHRKFIEEIPRTAFMFVKGNGPMAWKEFCLLTGREHV